MHRGRVSKYRHKWLAVCYACNWHSEHEFWEVAIFYAIGHHDSW